MTHGLRISGLALGICMVTLLVGASQRCEGQKVRGVRPTMATPSHSAIGKINGVPTMVRDGAPFFVLGAQCDIWRSTRQDAKTVEFFDGYRDMNATAVSVGIPWAKIEPEEDKYDFAFLDWFIRQAESHQLKLVINLFSTNVCGKVEELDGSTAVYPAYTARYVLSDPAKYQRMVLPATFKYDPAGPPMCPNDPDTLDRERRLVVQVAEHLRKTDTNHTVVMMQIDNEFYYQQWVGERPKDEKQIRCQCPYCNAKYDPAKYKNGEDFMFNSFADYVKGLTDAICRVYDIPLYVNSPWWPPYIVPIFLDRCPNLDMVGIDGAFTTCEPNMLSMSQLSRNAPFAAENPTEVPSTRCNLDVLPYYTIVGRQGIGNLLWECGPPRTVVEDKDASRRYGDALYPLKNAMSPIARARGTYRFIGWYRMRELDPARAMDTSGDVMTPDQLKSIIRKQTLFIRDGKVTRTINEDHFDISADGVHIAVSGTDAGIIIRTTPSELILAIPRARLTIDGAQDVKAEEGRFTGDKWIREKDYPTTMTGTAVTIEISEPRVIKISYRIK